MINAIRVALSPSSPKDSVEAVNWIETIKHDKANYPRNLRIAFRLIHIEKNDPFASNFILFGLQLLESCIRLCWNEMSQECKNEVKLRLEQAVLNNAFTENFLKDGLGKCVVEVIMREWPQNWPDLLPKFLGELALR